MDERNQALTTAIGWLREADGLLITAGAGMGVDSGLPDFRGNEGFWREYPALKRRGMSFEDMATPTSFEQNAALAWGFYGHRLALYRDTVPHDGFSVLKKWADGMPCGAFVFTSNVDGQFQRAGFRSERIHECHGTIHSLQCIDRCTTQTWSADLFLPKVNSETSLLENDPPTCITCGKLARPNILMFNDWNWVDTDSEVQFSRLEEWLAPVRRLVVVELGAGRALPTVRRFSERVGRSRVVRINPRDFAISPHLGVGIEGGSLHVLAELDAMI